MPDLQPTIDASTVERVMLHGDLQKLTAAQKVSYYRAVCESVGLNPLTQPFQYLVLNGKETLYARREATEQLRQLHNVSINIVGRELVEEIYVVTARATLPSGRTDENIGAVPLAGLKGESRANGMMKAETKAKRRVTLAICGLGLLDETEVESLPADAVRPPMGSYATVQEPPPDVAPLPPVGFVLISRVDTHPTKTPNLNRFRITFSDGRVAATINPMLASLAESFCRDAIPCKPTTKETRWGLDLVKLEREQPDEPELPIQEPLSADDIPFLWLLPVLLSVGGYFA